MYWMSKCASKKVAQATNVCRPFCQSTARSTAVKKCSRIKHDQSKACPTKHIRYMNKTLEKWHPKPILKISMEINIFAENVIFDLLLKKSIKTLNQYQFKKYRWY